MKVGPFEFTLFDVDCYVASTLGYQVRLTQKGAMWLAEVTLGEVSGRASRSSLQRALLVALYRVKEGLTQEIAKRSVKREELGVLIRELESK